MRTVELSSLAKAFEASFDASIEDNAAQARGLFLAKFPRRRLRLLDIDDYVVGKGQDSFCAVVESKTRAWAYIEGATAKKFGIYYGRYGKRKKGQRKRYHIAEGKFGKRKGKAFIAVRKALVGLVAAGDREDFAAIDGNPLSQMFKAKILSFYFPDRFINVCSDVHLREMVELAGLGSIDSPSKCQSALVDFKNRSATTQRWSSPKFMNFLYHTFMPDHLEQRVSAGLERPGRPPRRGPDFDKLRERWKLRGEESERHALAFEQERLIGLGLPKLADRIKDCRETPKCGYDFRSFTAPGVPRYIEVKTFTKDAGGHRFFLSANQLGVSTSVPCRDEYYFYLVTYKPDGLLDEVLVKTAQEAHRLGERIPTEFVMRFS